MKIFNWHKTLGLAVFLLAITNVWAENSVASDNEVVPNKANYTQLVKAIVIKQVAINQEMGIRHWGHLVLLVVINFHSSPVVTAPYIYGKL